MSPTGTALPVTYDFRLVALSVVIAVFGSYIALDLAEQVLTAQGWSRKLWLWGGAIALGLSIWAMHFIGMLAYNLPIPIAYNFAVVVIAMAVSIAGSGAGLFVVSRQQPLGTIPLLSGALFVGLGIVGLHLTAMESMRVAALPFYAPARMAMSVAVAIGGAGIALWIAFRPRDGSLLAEISHRLGSVLLMSTAIVGMHYIAMAAVDFKQSPVTLDEPVAFNNSRLAVCMGIATLVILVLTLVASFFGQRSIATRTKAETQRQSEERFFTLVQNASDIIAIMSEDRTISYVSPSIERILSYYPNDWLNKQVDALIHPDDLAKAERFLQNVYSSPNVNLSEELRLQHADGNWRDFEVIAKNLLANDIIAGTVTTCRDITQRKQTEAELQESKEKYQNLYDNAPDAYFSVKADGTIKTTNQFGADYLGYKKEELIGAPALITIYPSDREWFQEWFESVFAEKQLYCENEVRKIRKDGSTIWVRERCQLILDEQGNPTVLNVICRDITERKRAEQQLEQNAFYDALTGLPNRVLFMDRLEQTLERSKRQEDYLFAVLFLDLDRFKVINDSLGHGFGDRLLKAIARRLETCLRPTDTAARLGGDEFTVLLEISDISDALRVAERIRRELSLPFNLNGQEVFTGASIGITLNTDDYSEPEDLLRDADLAMYRAKELGKGRYEMFDGTMLEQALTRLQLETELRQAIEHQQFRVYYQPIIAFDTGRLVGFEALVRWQHPQRGLLYPSEFLLVVEETGLISLIDQWLLRQACSQTRQWQEQFSDSVNPDETLLISVNLSSAQFRQPELSATIHTILQETHLDARSLKLEITEKIIMANESSAIDTLTLLKNLGLQIYIDDFGTGYSSLGRLSRLPIDGLKIDGSFVNQMGVEKNLDIELIIAVAQKLAVSVTAEGVETAEQLAQLRRLHCDYGQGNFFSPPLDAEAAETLLTSPLSGQPTDV